MMRKVISTCSVLVLLLFMLWGGTRFIPSDNTWGSYFDRTLAPTCASVAFVCLGVMWLLAQFGLRIRRGQDGLCPNCGYDLRASTDRCPECGTAFDPEGVES